MLPEEQSLIYRALDSWFLTPQGARVGQAFSAEIEELHFYFKGNTLIQLGHCGESPWLSLLSYRNKWLVSPDIAQVHASCITSLTEMPFARDSVDCVIAPLTTELFSLAKSPIDEIDRILKPMGYIIYFGINPWSIWGLALRLGRLTYFAKFSNAVSSFSLKRSMLNRGYQQCFFNSFYYIPPISSPTLIHNMEFLNEVGKMVKPFPAGFYCLVMQKYQHAQPFLIADSIEESMACKTTLRAVSNTRLRKNV